MLRSGIRFIALAGAIALLAPAPPSRAAAVQRVSVASGGAQALYGNSTGCALDADGQVVAFTSQAQNLAPGMLTLGGDVYVHDRTTGTTERASASTGGTAGNNGSFDPSISADGRYVVFTSQATNLVSPATPFGRFHVYLRDRQSGVTSLVSVTSAGVRGDGHSKEAAISADGRWVAFVSNATHLVEPPTNGNAQVFRWDRVTGAIVLASVDGAGAQGAQSSGHPSISADGTRIAFHSQAALEPRFGGQQIFLRDLEAGTTELVSVSRTGLTAGNTHSANPEISADGHAVAFESWATDLLYDDPLGRWHVYVRDLSAGTTVRASVNNAGEMADGSAYNADINADGTRVVFETGAANLADDTNGNVDIFVRKLDSPAYTERVSTPDGVLNDPQGDGWSWFPSVSGDGTTIGFESWSTDLVAGDTNGFADVFVAQNYLPAWLDVAQVDQPSWLRLATHPNPVSASAGAQVRFTLPRACSVRLSIFDAQGRRVRDLAEGRWPAGVHAVRWDAATNEGHAVPAGVYFVRLASEREQIVHRLIALP